MLSRTLDRIQSIADDNSKSILKTVTGIIPQGNGRYDARNNIITELWVPPPNFGIDLVGQSIASKNTKGGSIADAGEFIGEVLLGEQSNDQPVSKGKIRWLTYQNVPAPPDTPGFFSLIGKLLELTDIECLVGFKGGDLYNPYIIRYNTSLAIATENIVKKIEKRSSKFFDALGRSFSSVFHPGLSTGQQNTGQSPTLDATDIAPSTQSKEKTDMARKSMMDAEKTTRRKLSINNGS